MKAWYWHGIHVHDEPMSTSDYNCIYKHNVSETLPGGAVVVVVVSVWERKTQEWRQKAKKRKKGLLLIN